MVNSMHGARFYFSSSECILDRYEGFASLVEQRGVCLPGYEELQARGARRAESDVNSYSLLAIEPGSLCAIVC